jgi:GT2 family glycosyltransferase
MRDIGTRSFLESGADYIIWFDADQVYPPDTILRLAEYLDCGLKIVAGLTPSKAGHPLAFRFISNDEFERDDSILPGKGLIEIDGCGMGGVAIAREVFEAFGPPWFERRDSEDHTQSLNEDIAFFLRAKRAGFQLYIDTDLTFEHIVSFPLSFNTPKIFREQVTR